MKYKPLIGITCSIDYERGFSCLKQGYYTAVQRAGGIAVLVPADDLGLEKDVIRRLDGIVLAGGPDVEPEYFGEESYVFNGNICPERDKQETALTRLAFEAGKPMLGICRGMQVLNIAMGGTIYQDIYSQADSTRILKHVQEAPRWYPSHRVKLEKDSRIFNCFGTDSVRVNSFHHQAVKEVASGFKATAGSSDGIIEAIEYIGEQFAVGVQWHPETMWEKDMKHLEIFKAFVDACKK